MNRSFIAVAVAIVAFAGNVAAQAITVVGTGDSTVDIPAVQAAVDQGGQIVLVGRFSFDAAAGREMSYGQGALRTRLLGAGTRSEGLIEMHALKKIGFAFCAAAGCAAPAIMGISTSSAAIGVLEEIRLMRRARS